MAMTGNAFADSVSITGQGADAIVSAARAYAEKIGIKVSIAVVDGAGHLLAFRRLPGAFLPTIDIALDKAATAVGFGVDTRRLYEVLKDNKAVVDGIATRKGVAMFGGGVPVTASDGQCAGAVGVSGGSEEQDIACAEAGVAALYAWGTRERA